MRVIVLWWLKLAAVRSGVAYGAAPALPRIVNGRALVYVAYAAANRGPVIALRFHVDEEGIDRATELARVARAISETLKVYPDRYGASEYEAKLAENAWARW